MKIKTECVRFCGNFTAEREAFPKVFSFKFSRLKLKIKAYKSHVCLTINKPNNGVVARPKVGFNSATP